MYTLPHAASEHAAPARGAGRVRILVVALALATAGCATVAGGPPAPAVPPAPPAPAAIGAPSAVPATPAVASSAAAPAPRKGYLLFRSTFPDPSRLRPYGLAVLPLVARYDGRFIVTADAPVALEGAPDLRRVVVVEFPSLARAREFWSSPEYAEVKKLREGLGEVDAILFEGR